MLDDADFTPNPDRAIWIEGKFTEALLDRLRPQILELTARNREPVTVFLNSDGGAPEVSEELLKLLRRTDQDGASPCKIITVGVRKALSGGANFLSAGNFSIAHPQCTLLYHGARWPLSDLVSAGEAGRLYAQTLPTFHEKNAAVLARNSVHRFLFLARTYRADFPKHRAEVGHAALTDVQCLCGILRGKLSPAGQKVLAAAATLFDSYYGFFLHFQKKLPRGSPVTKEHLRTLMLRSAVDCEFEKGDPPEWDGGLSRITDHFYFLNAYWDFGKLCEHVALPKAEPQTAGTDLEEDDFRLFFRALCRSLQEGENILTPMDALWLGLLDTVREDVTALS